MFDTIGSRSSSCSPDSAEVLDDNNRALEIITDMGDTLGGDYLFDIQYVRRSYADLHAAVGDSLSDFDVLTHSRYSRLREKFREIDDGIRHVIDETVGAAKELVVFYEQVAGDMVRDIGGKNCKPRRDQERLEAERTRCLCNNDPLLRCLHGA